MYAFIWHMRSDACHLPAAGLVSRQATLAVGRPWAQVPYTWFNAVLKFLVLFKQGALHFHFALGPADYITGPVRSCVLHDL